MQRKLKNLFKNSLCMLAQSKASLAHAEAAAYIGKYISSPEDIASLAIGRAYIRTQSLAMPIGLHFMANFLQGPVRGLASVVRRKIHC